jgi:hypothetical protein
MVKKVKLCRLMTLGKCRQRRARVLTQADRDQGADDGEFCLEMRGTIGYFVTV